MYAIDLEKAKDEFYMIEDILFVYSVKMCCNIPKLAAAPFDRQTKEKTEYRHSHRSNIFVQVMYQELPLLFNQIQLFLNNMTEFLPHVNVNRQCSRYLH